MSFPFDPSEKLIFVRVEIVGPLGRGSLRLGLDTAATLTMIGSRALASVGYGLSQATGWRQVVTGSQVERVA